MILYYIEQTTGHILAKGVIENGVYHMPKIGDTVLLEGKGEFTVYDGLIQNSDNEFDITIYLEKVDGNV